MCYIHGRLLLTYDNFLIIEEQIDKARDMLLGVIAFGHG